MAGADLTVNAVVAQDGDDKVLHVGAMAVVDRPDDELALSAVGPAPLGPLGFFFPTTVLSLQLNTVPGSAPLESTMKFVSMKLTLSAVTDYDQVQVSDGRRIAVADVDKRAANVFPEMLGKSLRVVNPGDAITADLRFDRVTITLDGAGRIDSARVV